LQISFDVFSLCGFLQNICALSVFVVKNKIEPRKSQKAPNGDQAGFSVA